MRIGTWNLAGRGTAAHLELLTTADCDVWLLTEVSDRLEVPGYLHHRTAALMAPRRAWAAVLTRDGAQPLPDPHPASAAVTLGATTFCSTVLPWRSCGDGPPWVGGRHADKTAAAVADLDATLPNGPLVWGGDWNHALTGPEYSGSQGGRAVIEAMIERRVLQVPTAELPHRIDRLLSIDHVAVGRNESVASAERIDATGLSDHDAYAIDVRFAASGE